MRIEAYETESGDAVVVGTHDHFKAAVAYERYLTDQGIVVDDVPDWLQANHVRIGSIPALVL